MPRVTKSEQQNYITLQCSAVQWSDARVTVEYCIIMRWKKKHNQKETIKKKPTNKGNMDVVALSA